jgi:integrase
MANLSKTLRNGALKIDILQYADGRFGFDWQPDEYDRKRVRLRSLADAEERARELLGATKAGTVDLLKIEPDEYAEFLRWRSERRNARPVPELVQRFLATKELRGLSEKHLRGLKSTLNLFAKSFPCSVGKLSRLGVEAWLEGRGVGPRRWNNVLADIVALIRFARRDGSIGTDLTPVELIERKKVEVTVSTYSPAELTAILRAVDSEWLPTIALGAFCGLRPEEIAPEQRNAKDGIRWENILWNKAKVDVPASVSKTRRRRFAPLPDAAAAFLQPWRGARGPVAPERRFCHYLPRLKRADKSIVWKADALRHSFASYRLAILKDIQELSLEMGNSPAMIHSHYLDLKHEDEAERWFGLRPSMALLDR